MERLNNMSEIKKQEEPCRIYECKYVTIELYDTIRAHCKYCGHEPKHKIYETSPSEKYNKRVNEQNEDIYETFKHLLLK